jgi:hypothetical protein
MFNLPISNSNLQQQRSQCFHIQKRQTSIKMVAQNRSIVLPTLNNSRFVLPTVRITDTDLEEWQTRSTRSEALARVHLFDPPPSAGRANGKCPQLRNRMEHFGAGTCMPMCMESVSWRLPNVGGRPGGGDGRGDGGALQLSCVNRIFPVCITRQAVATFLKTTSIDGPTIRLQQALWDLHKTACFMVWRNCFAHLDLHVDIRM